MNIREMTDSEVYERGLEGLLAKLGSTGTLRFLQLCESPTGDWTEERQAWVDALDMETLLQGIQGLRQQKRELLDNELPGDINELTDREVYRLGLGTISGSLGPAGQMRFLQLCTPRADDGTVSPHIRWDKPVQGDLQSEILRTSKVSFMREEG